jgi:hypothetical protein
VAKAPHHNGKEDAMSEHASTQAIIVKNEPVQAKYVMSPYERLVIDEMGRHRVQPGPIRRAMELVGKPVDKLARWASSSESAMVRQVHDSVLSSVEKSLRQTVAMALTLQSDGALLERFKRRGNEAETLADVRGLKLIEMDVVAESTRSENAALLGVEGAALGALATLGTVIPYAQVAIPAIIAADVAASMTLLSRSATMISSCYGFPASDPTNIPHVLSAMAPTQFDSDEGFVVMKSAAVAELRAAGEFMRRVAAKSAAEAGRAASTAASKKAIEKALEEAMSKNTPKLVRFIQSVAARLGIVITEKELGTLIPVAGAVVNGGLNVAFHHVGHTMAKDYFREQILVERYGQEAVSESMKKAMLRWQ